MARCALAVLLAGGLGALACRPAPPPSILLVTIDTLRADHCSAYGYARRTTPELDRLAGAGALFERFYAPTAVTAPSHAALFTAASPIATGVTRNGIALGDERPVLAEVTRDAGYETAAFVSSWVVSSAFGFARGFDHFDDSFPAAGATVRFRPWEGERSDEGFDRRAPVTTDRALTWLGDEARERPFFVWVHYFDPHRPYVPPPPLRERFLRTRPGGAGGAGGTGGRPTDDLAAWDIAGYDAEIRFADAQLARLVAAAERSAGPRGLVVAVTSDHGQGLMDHGWPSHGPLLYEEDLHIPLVLRAPDRVRPGARITAPASLEDLAPTLLGLAGLPGVLDDAALPGRSLVPVLAGRTTAAPDPPLHFVRRDYETARVTAQIWERGRGIAGIDVQGTKLAIRRGRWKLIDAPGEGTRELYDLERDPDERQDRAREHPELAHELASAVHAWREAQLASAPTREREVDPTNRERLRALGYAH